MPDIPYPISVREQIPHIGIRNTNTASAKVLCKNTTSHEYRLDHSTALFQIEF